MHELAHKTLINRKTLLRMVPLSDRTIYNLNSVESSLAVLF